jgi:predicted HTH domain antitoxin
MKNNSERVSLKEAAELMGVSPQCLRMMMRKKAINIGFVVEVNTKKSYIIFRERLNRVLGKETKK